MTVPDVRTKEGRETLRRLDDASTQSPWSWEAGPPTLYAGRYGMMHGLNLLGRLEPDVNGKANLDFIVAAHDCMATLLDEIERLTRENEELREEIEDAADRWREFAEQLDRAS